MFNVCRFCEEKGVLKLVISIWILVSVAPGDPVIDVNQKLMVSLPATVHVIENPAVKEVHVGGVEGRKV